MKKNKKEFGVSIIFFSTEIKQKSGIVVCVKKLGLFLSAFLTKHFSTMKG